MFWKKKEFQFVYLNDKPLEKHVEVRFKDMSDIKEFDCMDYDYDESFVFFTFSDGSRIYFEKANIKSFTVSF